MFMRYIIYFITILLFFGGSCNTGPQPKNNISENKNIEELLEVDIEDETDNKKDKTEIVLDTILLPNIHNEGIDILLTGMYRGEEPSDFSYLFQEEWYDLYMNKESKNYYLGKSDIDVSKFYDDCLQDSTTSVSTNNDESIILIKGLESKGLLKSIAIKQNMVWADSKMPFSFNGQEYSFRATGNVESENDSYVNEEGVLTKWQNVFNYKLYLSTIVNGKTKEQLLVSIPNTNNTNVLILFIGDLDGDEVPDFVFSTSRDYEEARVVLFLSSKAQGDEIVRCVGESSYQFDC